MDLFLDCEWADMLASELVSIALISTDGEHVFYAERDPLPSDPTPWVSTVVYPLLDRGLAAVSDAEMTRRLRAFLAAVDNPRICYDFGIDRKLCQAVISGAWLPELAKPEPKDLKWQLFDDIRPALTRWWADHPDQCGRRHHALVDAQALRATCLSLWGI